MPHPDNTANQPRLNRRDKVIQPLSNSIRPEDANTIAPAATKETDPALDMIRQKLNKLYTDEPNAKEEREEVTHLKQRSKHQQYMYELSQSGRSLAEIQTEWHNYYTSLSDEEKHDVWREFYAAHSRQPSTPTQQPHAAAPTPKPEHPSQVAKPQITQKPDTRTVSEVKDQIVRKVATRNKRKASAHIQSAMFGLSAGLVVIVVLLFGFFNERFIAPFITPSRAVSSTPIIIDPNSTAVGPESKITIPKINVEIPVVYDEPSIQEAKIQEALERGVVHYATTPNPGEKGNAVIFGHSANNILNKGKYKFAFVLLKQLELGDTFYLQKDGKRYVYKVFDKKIVPPSEVSVLSTTEKPATATLITCDPPGTATNRLVVIGEQISPDPTSNAASTVKQSATPQTSPNSLPGEPQSLWNRVRNLFQ